MLIDKQKEIIDVEDIIKNLQDTNHLKEKEVCIS